MAEGLEFFGERRVAENRVLYFGRELEKIGEQAVKDAKLLFERILAVFGESGGIGKELGEPLATGGALQDAKGLLAGLGGGVNVHFNGAAGAAFGELGGELDFGSLAGSFFFENVLHFGLRERRKLKLHAARHDSGKKSIRRRCGEDERRGARRFFENFQENVSDVPAHGFRPIENEDAAAAHRLKIGGALNGAQLADAKHRARDGSLEADGIGNESPDVGMRLENQRNALDSGRVGAFAALDKTLLEESLRIGKQSDAPAGVAFAAEIIGEAFTVGGLRKHTREGKLTDAARSAEEQRVRNAAAAKRAAKSCDDTFVAEEFGEAHGLAASPCGGGRKHGFDRSKGFRGDFLGRAHGATGAVKTLDGGPGRAAGEEIVHCCRLFQVAQAGFEQVFLRGSVAASGFLRDEFLGLARRNTQIQNQVFARKPVNPVFEMLDPFEKRGALVGGDAGGLMGEIRSDVTVGENSLAVAEGGFEFRLGFEAIAGVEQCGEMRVDGFERAEVAVQELADHFAKPGIVLREAGGVDGMAAGAEGVGQQFHLRALAAAVDAFNSNEFSESGHSL